MRVGDYIRTKDYLGAQLICKIEKILDEYCIDTDKGYWDTEHIIKSSPNIIDLIEVGDYVNGERVIALKKMLMKEIYIRVMWVQKFLLIMNYKEIGILEYQKKKLNQ